MPEIIVTGDRGSIPKSVKIEDNSIVDYELYLTNTPYAYLIGIRDPDYKLAYKDQIKVPHDMTNTKVCETLFVLFNGGYGYPAGYKERSMSVGDRVKLTRGGITTTYETGSFGWFELK